MPPIVTDILKLMAQAGLDTLEFLYASLFPIVALCLLLLVIGRFMNRRLFETFGWQAVLLGAWIGTPVHEFSHLIGCWIGRNRVEDFALFKPDSKSGSLGYVKHSYESSSFYQRVIGNTLVGLAPFFGGSLAIYLLTRHFFPGLLIAHPEGLSFTLDRVGSLGAFEGFARAWGAELMRFAHQLSDTRLLGDWSFWFYLFAMISLAAHVSPSRSDFEGLGRPLLVLLALLYLTQLALAALKWAGIVSWQLPVLNPVTVVGLLALALVFLLLGTAFVVLVTFLAARLFGAGEEEA